MTQFVRPSVQFHMDLAKAALTGLTKEDVVVQHAAADAWQFAKYTYDSMHQSVRDELERADARWLAQLNKPE